MKKGKITSWEAITKFRATRLSDIIWKMRNRGYDIYGIWETNKDGTRYMVYNLNKWGTHQELLEK